MPVEIDSEDLDLSSIHDEEYVRKLVEIYALKYRSSPPNLIIATHTTAARLLLNHSNELFPGVPIVFCAAVFSSEELEQLPPDVTGVTSKGDFSGTLKLMSRLHPDMRPGQSHQVQLIFPAPDGPVPVGECGGVKSNSAR
jgi:two-component system cell cycle sensor histidine kinase/response regulator CckA